MSIKSDIYREQPYWLNFIFFGNMYQLDYRTTINDGETIYLQLKTPPDFLIHILKRIIRVEGETVQMRLIKEPTITDGTNELTPQNLDDRFDKNSNLIIYDNPTAVSGGTEKARSVAYGATRGNVQASGLFDEVDIERVLEKGLDYVIEFVNEGETPTDLLFSMLYYESRN